MTLQIIGLCRGDGKGYVKIKTSSNPDELTAFINTENNDSIQCPVISIGFPGEDKSACEEWGDFSHKNSYESVVAVPLLDNTKLTVHIKNRNTHEEIGTFLFHPLFSKVKSRLTYHERPEFASQIR